MMKSRDALCILVDHASKVLQLNLPHISDSFMHLRRLEHPPHSSTNARYCQSPRTQVGVEFIGDVPMELLQYPTTIAHIISIVC